MPIDPTQVEAIFAEAVGMSDAARRGVPRNGLRRR